jgi:tetratricopeptide (TPR) repeat protein
MILAFFLISKGVLSQCDTMNMDYQKGLKYYHKKDYDKAYYCFNKALDDEPNLAKAYFYKAHILNNLKEDSIAILMLDKAIQVDTNYVDAYYFKAYLCFYNSTNDQNDPLTDITKVIELKPQYADAYQFRSDMYINIGEDTLALKDINRAIEIDPNEAHYYYCRGSIKQSMKDKDGACKDFSIAKKLGFNKLAIKMKEVEYCNKKE